MTRTAQWVVEIVIVVAVMAVFAIEVIGRTMEMALTMVGLVVLVAVEVEAGQPASGWVRLHHKARNGAARKVAENSRCQWIPRQAERDDQQELVAKGVETEQHL